MGNNGMVTKVGFFPAVSGWEIVSVIDLDLPLFRSLFT